MNRRQRKNFIYGAFLSFFFLSITSFLPGCNCDGPGLQNLDGKIKTDLPGEKRPNLIFTEIVVNKDNKSSFKLFNSGLSSLTISDMEIIRDVNKVFSITDKPKLPLVLEPGEEKGVTVTISLKTAKAGQFTAMLKLSSSDAINVEEDGSFYIQLRHQILTPDPEIKCKSIAKAGNDTLHFGKVKRGEEKTLECNITNSGNADLEIKGQTYKKSKGSDNDFRWVGPKFPIKLKANRKGSITVKISYKPSDYPPAEDEGAFLLKTNIQGESDTTRTKIRVIGLTLVPLVELIPFYPPCNGPADCEQIDQKLKCKEDRPTGKKLCLPKSDTAPAFLKFPLTGKGKTTKRRFLIRSTGPLPLKVSQITINDSNKDFKVINPGLPFTLEVSKWKEIEVEYSPKTDKKGKGTLYVHSNAGNKAKAPLLLQASSFGCDLEPTPRKLRFTGPQSFQVRLINRGNANCLLRTIQIKGGQKSFFSLLPQQSPNQTLAPRSKLEFLVKFNPSSKNKETDFVVIKSNDADEPTLEIPLEGQVRGTRQCELEASPSTLNYSLVALGRSRKRTVNIKNRGWGECTITSLNVLNTKPGGVTAFRMTNTVHLPFKINAGSNLRLEIAFTPPQETGYEGNITIVSNDTVNPNFKVNLLGSSGTFCLEVVPQNMDFGSTKFGCATPTRKIELFNIGAAKCSASIQVTKIKCAPGDCFPIDQKAEFRINSAPALPASIGKGQKIDIGMSYKAKDLGVDSSTLEVYNNIPGQSPIQIPLIGEGVSTDHQKDVFAQNDQPSADILFIIDDSCSMADEQANLAKNFGSFIQWAIRLNVDYQIGVTTTDVTGRGRALKPGCLRGSTKIITPRTPNPTTTFKTNAVAGTQGSASELGLEAAYKALSTPASTGCNRGFYRQKASLSMIFISDETDQSRQTVQFYVSFFKSLKGPKELDKVRASAVVGPPATNGCKNPGTGNAFAAPRYWQVAKELNGVRESICSSNWAGTLSSIGSITFGYRSQFFLSRQADPKTIKVKVNGNLIKQDPQDGWQYESTNNSVNFSKSQVPAPRSVIEVTFQALCLP